VAIATGPSAFLGESESVESDDGGMPEARAVGCPPSSVLGACCSIQTTPESELRNRAERREVKRILKFLNGDTGEVLEGDPAKMRVARMKRRMRGWARTLGLLKGRFRTVMVTLTFALSNGWYAGSISEYIESVSEYLKENLIAIGWTGEIQMERLMATGESVMHYHVPMVVREGTDVPCPDKSGMWKHGVSKRETWTGGIGYIWKYPSKGVGEGAEYPGGARMYGVSKRHWKVLAMQGSEVRQEAFILNKLSVMPVWVQKLCNGVKEAILEVKKVKGGWLLGDAVHRSPWRLIW
jgi:hypothetical protein